MGEQVVSSALGPYTLSVLDGDHIAKRLAATGRPYEERLLTLAVRLTRPGDHVVDVGANVGNHTVYWALAGRRVTAFEPNPAVHALLAENVERNGLADRVRRETWALGRSRSAGALRATLEDNAGAVAVDEDPEGSVQIERLDALDLAGVRLVKIDVEGHEADVLAGAVALLRRDRPFVIAEATSGHDEVSATLAALGYRRIPVSLASTPTFLYAAGASDLARALRAPELLGPSLKRPVLRARSAAFRRLPQGLRERLRPGRG